YANHSAAGRADGPKAGMPFAPSWFWPPQMQRPVTLLRWRFGPQPPRAAAGVAAYDRSMAISAARPSRGAKSFIMAKSPLGRAILIILRTSSPVSRRYPELGINAVQSN
ncbi:hypothetical protein, partial [Bradyrhizobium sp. RDI18]|uniref:hypothetical protein n=1 Tax=Bradyrhizobium sp. RDI18 TaxID=3367400 RepID=UPI0037230AE4